MEITYEDIVLDHLKSCPRKRCNYVPKPSRSPQSQEFDKVAHNIPFFTDNSANSDVPYSLPPHLKKGNKNLKRRYICYKSTSSDSEQENQQKHKKTRSGKHSCGKPLKKTSNDSVEIIIIDTDSDNTQGNSTKKQFIEQNTKEVVLLLSMENDIALRETNVSTLVNMGNTCYLNSVLYSLRFVPRFMHNLHHLIEDLNFEASKFKEARNKTSSLGRNGNTANDANWRSASSKDLLSIGNDAMPKSGKQIVTEKLHSLYVTMSNLEIKNFSAPHQPKAVLQAIVEDNQIFEGNEQQDAHELLGYLISCIKAAIEESNERMSRYQINEESPKSAKSWSWQWKLNKGTQSANMKNSVFYDSKESDTNHTLNDSSRIINFVKSEMEGMEIVQTICLECESVSERREIFRDIQVPVPIIREDDDLKTPKPPPRISRVCTFEELCLSPEKLCDQNKYFCGECGRHCEALRKVSYEKLPNILIFQLKRFTSTMQKNKAFVPTPLEFRCFCVTCTRRDTKKESTDHNYKLYCVIMHLGADMASGHYITYARATQSKCDYANCSRGCSKSSSAKESMSFLKLFKPTALPDSTQNGIGTKQSNIQICKSYNCCGVRCDDAWWEFDDSSSRLLTTVQLTDILNQPQETSTNHSAGSTNTPYLLFYAKVPPKLKRERETEAQ